MSGALQASADTRASYLSNYHTAARGLFGNGTLAQMATQAAADEVAELLNVTMASSSLNRRRGEDRPPQADRNPLHRGHQGHRSP